MTIECMYLSRQTPDCLYQFRSDSRYVATGLFQKPAQPEQNLHNLQIAIVKLYVVAVYIYIYIHTHTSYSY